MIRNFLIVEVSAESAAEAIAAQQRSLDSLVEVVLALIWLPKYILINVIISLDTCIFSKALNARKQPVTTKQMISL